MDAAKGGTEVVASLARSAKVNGPTAFCFGAGVGLALLGLALRAGDKIDYATFKLALIFALPLVAIAGVLALLRFRIQARVTASDLDAANADQEAAKDFLKKASEPPLNPYL